MFDLGIQELIVIFVVALIVFGPKRLPELGKALGKGMLELRKAMEGIKEQMHAESDMTHTNIEDIPKWDEKKGELNVEADKTQTNIEGYAESEKKKDETNTGQRSPDTEKTPEVDEKLPGERKEDTVNGR